MSTALACILVKGLVGSAALAWDLVFCVLWPQIALGTVPHRALVSRYRIKLKLCPKKLRCFVLGSLQSKTFYKRTMMPDVLKDY